MSCDFLSIIDVIVKKKKKKKKKNVDLTSWAITFLHGMAWIAIHYDKKNHLRLDNEW
jgi:hypothetical protein